MGSICCGFEMGCWVGLMVKDLDGVPRIGLGIGFHLDGYVSGEKWQHCILSLKN